jgi:pimeloyl-[acyl-carrier protein] methyl ester esterase
MGNTSTLELLFLHALPFDGSMWAEQMRLLGGATVAPTLYAMGDSVEAWAAAALERVAGDRLIVVGCSVGGSCAIEVARAAPDRVAALVLISTKAEHRPDPALHACALKTLGEHGMSAAWQQYWAPLFSASAEPTIVAAAEQTALAQSPAAVARGVTAFHTRPGRIDFLAAFQRPVIIVAGTEDAAPGLKTSASQAASAPLGSLHIVAGCGHYAPLEKPQELNEILRDVIGCA